MLGNQQARSRFGLEELEPRLLLSVALAPLQPAHGSAPVTLPAELGTMPLTPSGSQATPAVDILPTPASAAPSSSAAPSTGAPAQSAVAHQAIAPADGAALTQPSGAAAPASGSGAAAAGGYANSHAQQLTATLKVANAPPGAPAHSIGYQGPGAAPQAVIDYGSEDLATFVDDVLAGTTGTVTETFANLDSVTIGNFIELRGVTLTFNASQDPNGVNHGAVSFSAQSGVLYPGTSFSGTTAGITNPGNYNLDTGNVTFQTSNLNLAISGALAITAPGALTFTYNTSGPANQAVATVQGAGALSPEFANLTSTILQNFSLRNDGFSFSGFSLTSIPGVPVVFTNGLLTAGGGASVAELDVPNFNVTFGLNAVAPAPITLQLPGLQLYPGGGLLLSQAAAVTGVYDFSDFDGVHATGALRISVTGLQMTLGQALQMSVPGVTTLLPEQPVLATLANVTLSSPLFNGLGAAAVQGVALANTGFTLGDFSLVTAAPVTIGSTLAASSATVVFSDFGLAYSQPASGSAFTATVEGEAGVQVNDAVLFPGVGFLNVNLGVLGGSYTDSSQHWTGVLSLGVPSLDLPLGDALTVHLGTDVSLQPGNFILAQGSASVTANLFSGLTTASLPGFQLTQAGFSLGSFSLSPVSGSPVTIGGYLSFASATLDVNAFAVSLTPLPIVTGSISATVAGTTLFPGDPTAVSSFSSVAATYDFGGPAALGALTLALNGFALTVANELQLTEGQVLLTPAGSSLATLSGASLTVLPLGNLHATVDSITLTPTGLSFGGGSFSATTAQVGQALDLTTPTLSFQGVAYAFDPAGGSLEGTLALATANADLELSASLQTASTPLNGGFDLAAATLKVSMTNFQVDLPSFVDIGGASASVSYQGGSGVFLVVINGVNLSFDAGSGPTAIGLQVGNASLVAAVFPNGGSPTYALQASGSLAVTGGLAGTLSFGANANVLVRYNNTGGAVNQSVDVDGNPADAITLSFTGNETSIGGNLSLSVGTFATITGDCGLSLVSGPGGAIQAIAVGATNVAVALNSAALGLGVSLVGGATPLQVSLLLLPGSPPTFALASSGGTIAVDGIPDLTLTGANLRVIVNNTGQAPATLPGSTQTIFTPGGSVTLNFAGVSDANLQDIQGSVTKLQVGDFLSVSGDFGFQSFSVPGGGSGVILAASNVNAMLGTDQVNLTITGASLGLLLVPGTPAAYALVSNGGTDSLNNVPGLTLTANNLIVKINTGVPANVLSAATQSLQTPGGVVAVDFTSVGAGEIQDVEGTVLLGIDGFATLSGSFGFQAATDPDTRLTDIVAGATNIDFKLGTSDTNLEISGASFALVIVPDDGGNSAFGLLSNGGTDSLNGVPNLTLTANNLRVEINSGLTPSMLDALPDAVHTPGGDIPLDFSPVDSGDLAVVQGSVTLGVAGFVSVTGDFGFQAFSETPGGPTELIVAAENVDATLGAGGVQVSITDASLALFVVPGSGGNPAGVALVATGGTNSLDGVTGLTLEADNLIVKYNTGLDLTSFAASSQNVLTPDGEVNLGEVFAGLGPQPITSIQGTLTLALAGFVSVTGNFGFQRLAAPGGGSDILVGADQVNATLGTDSTYVSIEGASLGLLLIPGTGYALVARGGNDALEGVPGLDLQATNLAVKFNNTNQDVASLVATQTAYTADGPVDVGALLTGLGSAPLSSIEGTVALTVADVYSVSGSFSFAKTISGGVTKLIAGATNVTTFVGTSDHTVGVQITNAQLGLVVYIGDETTYALYASAPLTAVGLPDNLALSGTVNLAVNTTNAAVNESVTTPGGTVNIVFTDGTSGTPDQTNIVSFGGSNVTLTLQTNTNPVTLSGSFSFTFADNATLFAASGVSATGITTDLGTSVDITQGTLGLAVLSNGYALTASATVSAGGGGGAGTGTISMRRNTTPGPVNLTIAVLGAAPVQVVFSPSEVKTEGTAFQSFALSNVNLSVDNTLLFVADSISTTNNNGVSIQAATGATLTLQDPSGPTVLLSLTAGSATYATVSPGATYDNMMWANGGTDVMLQNASLSLGRFVTFAAGSVVIQRYQDGSGNQVTTFNFTSTTIALFANGQRMVSITGNLQFSYSTANGFQLTGVPTITGFSFFGAGLGASANIVAHDGSTTKLGPITLTDPSLGLSNFSLRLTGDLAVTVTVSAGSGSIATSIKGFALSAAATSPDSTPALSGSFNLALKFNLADLTTAPTVSASAFALTVRRLTITIGPYLTLSADSVAINPTPDASQPLVSFGGDATHPGLNATLNVGSFSLSGGAGNFSIGGDGSFVAGNNFFVTFSLGQNPNVSALKWPDWLPLQSATIVLTWPDNNFNEAPGNFLIDLSATIALNSIQGVNLSLTGSFQHVIIDTSLLNDGKFPIIAIRSVNVTVSGSLFGCDFSGTLIAGVLRFDQNGALVDALGKIESSDPATNGQPGVGPFTSIFYGGIRGSLTISGIGFSFQIGLSQYGPLSIYVSLGVPVPIPYTPLVLTNFRGGVVFSGLPNPLSNPPQGSDALKLSQKAFDSPANLTPEEWQMQMEQMVAQQYLQSLQPGGVQNSWSQLTGPITIQAGLTLLLAKAPASVWRVDGDIFFDTSGKFLVVGSMVVMDQIKQTVKIYADLSGVVQPSGSVNILFLMNLPELPAPQPVPLQIYGLLSVQLTNTNGQPVTEQNPANQIQLKLDGGLIFNAFNQLVATLTGNLTVSFTVNSSGAFLQVDASASLNVTNLGDLGSVGGTLTLQIKPDATADLWGALLLTANLGGPPAAGFNNPQMKGLAFTGTAFFELNTSAQSQTVSVTVGAGPPTVLTLQPQLFGMYLNGSGAFTINGQPAFSLSGTLAVAIDTNSVTVFVQATLQVGPPAAPLFSFTASGLMYLDSSGFAAMLTLTFKSSSVPGLTALAANSLLVVNTTLKTITYTIPNPPPTSPPTPGIATVRGPKFSGSDPTATVSYETPGAGGSRTLVIPKGAPPTNADPSTWNVADANAYFLILVRGTLTISSGGTGLSLTGALSIVATFDPITGALGFSLDAKANLNLMAGGKTVYSFQIQTTMVVTNDGVAAYLDLTLAGAPPDLGFSFAATFVLKLNTTNTDKNLATPGGNQFIPANTIAIVATGTLNTPGLSIQGTFSLSASNNIILVNVNGTVNVLGLVGLQITGFAGIYDDANPGIAFSLALTVAGGGKPQFSPVANVVSISGSLLLQVNTCLLTRTQTGGADQIKPGKLIKVNNLDFYLAGFNLTGSLTITLFQGGWSITIPGGDPLTLKFFGDLATIMLSGSLDSQGRFSISGRAAFNIGASSFGISGSVAITFSNTLPNSFSAVVTGQATAFGLSVGASAAVSVDAVTRKVTLSVEVASVIPAVHIHTPALTAFGVTIIPEVDFYTPEIKLGGTASFNLGTLAPPPAPPPPPPVLAALSGGTLVLYLGADVANRNVPAKASEQCILTEVPGDPGSSSGQTILVAALGLTAQFANVTSILVNNTQSTPAAPAPGNVSIQIAREITVPVTITVGSGTNSINTGSGPATLTITGNGDNKLVTGPALATLIIQGNGNNSVTAGGPATVTVNGNGANSISIAGLATVTVNGNGNNRITTGAAQAINLIGQGSNLVTVGGAAAISVQGNGNNNIFTGAGYVAITVSGFGSNSIQVGSGGGVYLENPGPNPLVPPPLRKTTLGGDVGRLTVQVTGYTSYLLTNTDLIYGNLGPGGANLNNYDLLLAGVQSVALATANSSAPLVILLGWTGTATVTGSPQTKVYVNPGAVTAQVDYVLSDTAVRLTIGGPTPVTTTTALLNVPSVTLVGGNGINNFDVSNWHGTGGATGPDATTSINTVIAANDSDFYLDNGVLSRAGNGGPAFGVLQLKNIQLATLTGGVSVNHFQVAGTSATWTGKATLNGVGGNDLYAIYYNGRGAGAVTVNDPAANSQDALTVNGSRTLTVTPNLVKVLAQRVYYGNPGTNGGVASLNAVGLVSGLRYNVPGTNDLTDTTVTANAVGNGTINLGSRVGMVLPNLSLVEGPVHILAGPTDTLRVTDSAVDLDHPGNPLLPRTGLLTNAALTGLGMGQGATYSNTLGTLIITLGGGGNDFTIASTNANTVTTLNTGAGNDTVNVLATSGITNVNSGANGVSTINVGSLAPLTGGVVDNLLGVLTVTGNGSDTLNVDDTGSAIAVGGKLTSTMLTGLSDINPLPVIYDIMFSTDLIHWTQIDSVTTNAPHPVWPDPSFLGPLGFYRVFQELDGGGKVEVRPSIAIISNHVQLSWLNTGQNLNYAGIKIVYSGLDALNLSLGSGGNTFTIQSTSPGTVTSVNTGSGNDTVNVQTTGGTTDVNTQAGANAINVGSLMPTRGGITDGIQGALNIAGNGADPLVVDDSGSQAVRNGTETATQLTGLGMGPNGITFSGVSLTVVPGPGDGIIHGNSLPNHIVASSSALDQLHQPSPAVSIVNPAPAGQSLVAAVESPASLPLAAEAETGAPAQVGTSGQASARGMATATTAATPPAPAKTAPEESAATNPQLVWLMPALGPDEFSPVAETSGLFPAAAVPFAFQAAGSAWANPPSLDAALKSFEARLPKPAQELSTLSQYTFPGTDDSDAMHLRKLAEAVAAAARAALLAPMFHKRLP